MNNLYAIFDKKADEFDIIWEAKNPAVASRAFINMVKDQNNPMNAYPEDYELYQLGTFERKTGKVNGEIVMIMPATQALGVPEKKED